MEHEVDASRKGPILHRVCQPSLGTEEANRRSCAYVRISGETSHTVSLEEGRREKYARLMTSSPGGMSFTVAIHVNSIGVYAWGVEEKSMGGNPRRGQGRNI